MFIEAYRQTSWMRFRWGTVACVAQPDDRRLLEFGEPEAIRFRIRVTSAGEPPGLVLAQADGIRPSDPGVDSGQRGREPLLPVRPGDDLGEEAYRVDFDGNAPVLVINRNLGDWRAVARDEVFRALVYPSIVREILTRVRLVNKRELDDIDDGDWQGQWLRFAQGFSDNAGLDPRDWITEVVEKFCGRHGTLGGANRHFRR